MTAQDKSNVIQLINYYKALSKRAHSASRKEGLAQVIAGYSSGRADALHEVCGDLMKLVEAGGGGNMKTMKLPAPIGAKVFTHFSGKIEKCTITGYRIGADGVKEVYYKRKDSESPNWVAYIDEVDFTRRDAEKRLAGEVES